MTCLLSVSRAIGAGDLSHLRRLRKAISSKANDFIRFIYKTGVQEVS